MRTGETVSKLGVSRSEPAAVPDLPRPVEPAALPLPEGQVIVDGRRYRLVPVEPTVIAGTPCAAAHLTARELQIAALVAEGRVNKQIAAELQISEWTVSTHLRRMFAKLGVDTRAAMVSRCLSALGR
jgi:DNA-binding CsgD family transcriptional regulator